ncbi:MAG: S8 family serine peptidase [Verrucomicrobia bacterium]|nr:S8 family serine peptidase [Verrucomicrobiota bacterium]
MIPKSSIPLILALAIPPLGLAGSSAYAQEVASDVPAGIQFSKDLGRTDPSTEINITVHLKLSDKAAFDAAVDALYDPVSPTFHQWMTNDDLKKFAPSEAQRSSVRQELEAHGLTILSTDPIGFMIRARGTIANVESAFNTEIHQFEHDGIAYRANVRDIRLSGEAGNYVSSVAGIESHQMRPLAVRAEDLRTHQPFPSVEVDKLPKGSGFPAGSTTTFLSAPESLMLRGTNGANAAYSGTVYTFTGTSLVPDYLPSQLQTVLGLNEVYAAGYDGKGQTIALVEGYGYPTLERDANTFAGLANLPPFTGSNFRIVYPEGKPNPELGITSGWNIEIALDIDWAHTVAPGAKILEVITNGQDNEDFQASILYVAEHDLANSVSNSYEEDLDLLAGRDEQISWDDVLEIATAKGISVNFSTGDSGDNGLGSPMGSPGVPSDAPHATAVGGTSILNDVYNPGATITTSWGDTVTSLEASPSIVDDPPSVYGLLGGGGGGESVFWKKPSWQRSLPGTGRQTPDVSALADPYTGVPIVITVGNTQEVQFGWGGTSLACPIFSGFWAIANEKAGKPLGQAARAIAALPYGGVQDVLPTTDSTPFNVTGSITDKNGTTNYSASELFAGAIYGNKGFTSALWPHTPPFPGQTIVAVFGFGIDSSLTVSHGWDNATGWGTPYGLTFINAVTAKKK